MHTLGKEGRDKITGFKGIITSRVQYLTGCDQYCLTPKVNEKGETQTGEYFDEARIEVVGNGILPEEVTGESKGGAKPRCAPQIIPH